VKSNANDAKEPLSHNQSEKHVRGESESDCNQEERTLPGRGRPTFCRGRRCCHLHPHPSHTCEPFLSLSRTRSLSGRSLSSTLLLVIMAYLRHCLLISLCAPRTAPHLLINYCFIIALIFIILLLKNVSLLSLQFKVYAI
jgi:hypothetical protein